MDYVQTVKKVHGLLKEKGVCASSRKSHHDCYEAFEIFMTERKEPYSQMLRKEWVKSIRGKLPRQRCMIWEKYLLQLEEMDATGTISDRLLYLNRSDYDKLSAHWKNELDVYLEDCKSRYTKRTLELTRKFCSRALLFLMDNGIDTVDDISYDAIFMLMDADFSCTRETKGTILNNTSRMFGYWARLGWCSMNFRTLMNSHIYPHVGRVKDFIPEHIQAIELTEIHNSAYSPEELKKTKESFIESLTRHGYVGTTLKLANHALTAFYLFLDIHSLSYHPDIMWIWFEEISNGRRAKNTWLHWRRILRCYEDYVVYGEIPSVGKYNYEPDSISLLQPWCRSAISGFLEQKRRESRAPGTVRSYSYPCVRFCRFLEKSGNDSFSFVTPDVIRAFAKQDKHTSFTGRNDCFVIIRAFLRYLWENGYTVHPNLDRCLMTGSAPEEKIVDILSDEQLKRINVFRDSHTSPIELRDAAIVLLGVRMGFRASDVLNLRFSDIDWANRKISILMNKTQTQITLPMPVDVGNAIYAYIKKGRPKVGGERVFIRSRAPYGMLSCKVCSLALCRILPERSNVIGGGFHVTRRTFATNLLRNKAGIDNVMDALGHRDPTSVMRYLLLDDERSRKCGLSLKEAGIAVKGGLK